MRLLLFVQAARCRLPASACVVNICLGGTAATTVSHFALRRRGTAASAAVPCHGPPYFQPADQPHKLRFEGGPWGDPGSVHVA